jgi:hypothetical protein
MQLAVPRPASPHSNLPDAIFYRIIDGELAFNRANSHAHARPEAHSYVDSHLSSQHLQLLLVME